MRTVGCSDGPIKSGHRRAGLKTGLPVGEATLLGFGAREERFTEHVQTHRMDSLTGGHFDVDEGDKGQRSVK